MIGVKNKIFAIEGEWNDNLRKKETIKSSLTLLEEVSNINHIYRKVNTVVGLVGYLKESKKMPYQEYDIIFLAFHGTRYDIEMSKNNYISIKDLADNCNGWFNEKHIHFSSCAVGLDPKRLEYFKEVTGAASVSGYKKTIDFFESSIFDMVLLQKLTEYSRMGSLDNYLKSKFKYLYNKLGFKMIYN
ncbi:DUF6642 family protein [Mesoflavibacter zeaxanthinifaciens]|uniref:DUF6642 family protein n=1 Tax=Mesoflavibacter zeaxanthinifaciens TaxID=393060 RepID=UPI003A9245F9